MHYRNSFPIWAVVLALGFGLSATACSNHYSVSPFGASTPTPTTTVPTPPTATPTSSYSAPLTVLNLGSYQPLDVAVSSAGNIFMAAANGPGTFFVKMDQSGNVLSSTPTNSSYVAANSLNDIYYSNMDEVTDGLVFVNSLTTTWPSTTILGSAVNLSNNNHTFIWSSTVLPQSFNIAELTPSGAVSVSSTYSAGWGVDEMENPRALALDSSGYMYIADWSGSQNRIEKYSPIGSTINYISWGSWGNGPGYFRGCDGICVSPAGYVYVVDANNGVVQKFDENGNYHATWATSNPALLLPKGICSDSSNNLYLADWGNNRIVKFNF